MVNSSMDVQTGHVLQKLFSEGSLDNISVERLQQIVEEHPYFTFAQFLLARKLRDVSSTDFEAQSQKAALYFNEPIWLQTLLQPSHNPAHVIRQRTEEPSENGREHIEEISLVSQEVRSSSETNIDEHIEPTTESFSTEVSADEVVDAVANADVETIEQSPNETEDVAAAQEESKDPETPSPLAETERQEVNQETAPIFEPYHTVDYFASQGIKISNELKPNDRLGLQLRSFTEWLKTMKRFPETQIEQQLDEVSQQNIQEFASHSLDDKEVVTESMAEVLLKQYKYAEAVKIYEKLSLLDPSKRAYFAAKIEQLKGS